MHIRKFVELRTLGVAQGKRVTSTKTATSLRASTRVLLSAQATGTDKKTGATLYKLTLYDQNKAVATGTGFRLDIRDPNGPNNIDPNSALNNPPAFFGIQKMHDITDSQGTWDVVGAYGPIRARLNPMSGKDDGDYFHGQSNGHGYTHGCLCYGTDTRFAEYMGTTCLTHHCQQP